MMKSIMIIDDELEIVNTLSQYLHLLGYQTVRCSESELAIKTFTENIDHIGLVITDLTMPNLTGDQIIREIKKHSPHIPVFLCSGYNPGFTLEEIKHLGALEFIQKPFEYKKLAQLIKSHILS